MSNKMCVLVIAVAIAIFASAQCVWAVDSDGTWLSTVTSTGDWSVADNWADATIATGDGYTAYFMGDIAEGALIKVNVDAGREGQVIGNLYFNDFNGTTAGSWLVQGSTTLTLSGTTSSTKTSTISFTPVTDSLGAEVTAAEISAPVSVASGTNLLLSGTGGGTLKLSGNTTVASGTFTADGACTVNVTGSLGVTSGYATVTGGSTLNVTGSLAANGADSASNSAFFVDNGCTANVSGAGTLSTTGGGVTVRNILNLGLTSTDAVTATLKGATADAALAITGSPAVVNIQGASTVSTTGATVDKVELAGNWGQGTLNMYNSSVLNTASLIIVRWGTQGVVNLHDSAKLNATNVEMATAAAGSTSTLNMYDSSTANIPGSLWVSENQLSGAPNTSTLNMYNNSVMNVGTFGVVRWGSGGRVGSANLYDNAQVNATTVTMNNYTDAATGAQANLTLNNSSKLYATNISVAEQGNATMVVNDNAEVHVSGTLNTVHYALNGNGTTGEVDVNGHGKIYAGSITSNAQWSTTACTSTWKLTDNALVSTTGNFLATPGPPSPPGVVTITMDKNSQLNVGGRLSIDGESNCQGTATLTISCLSGETASVTANSMLLGTIGWNGTGTFNIGGYATANITNNMTVGQGTNNSSGVVNASGNAHLTIGGNVNASNGGNVTLNDNATMSVVGNYTINPANPNSFVTDVTGRDTSTNTSLTVGGNLTLASTNGTLIVDSVSSGPASNGGLVLTGPASTLYFNGGQIKSGINTTTFLHGIPHAIIQAGGAKFNLYDNVTSTIRSVTVAQNLEHDSALGSTADGGLSVLYGGTLTLTGALTYTGPTTINTTSTLKIYSPGTTSLAAITGSGDAMGNLVIGDGSVANTVSANSVSVGALTIGAGSTLTINAIAGGPSAGSGLTAVPEPSTLVLLAMAAIGLIGAAWRRRNS